MNNVLIALGVLIVVVLSTLFAVPYFVDWNAYRGVIEEEASRMVGRDVRIGGEIKLQLLPSPSFVIAKLRIADAATGSGEPLFRAERVHARLSIVPLFRGTLEANEIELVSPMLRFVLDDSGHGNLRSLVHGQGTLPFVPADVALQAVRITDGTLAVLDRNGRRERLTLAHLEGVLSAPALEGPYRFKGSYGSGAEAREVRLSTAAAGQDGAVPVKATLRDPATTATALLDGTLHDLFGQPRFTGELTAQLPLAPPASTVTAAGLKPSAPASVAELKSEIDGDAQKLTLRNLSIAFESGGRPQVLAGGAIFTWGDVVTTSATLSAPWVDLDTVFGTTETGSPLTAMAQFGQRINGVLGGSGETNASIAIEQANLGRDLVSGIKLEARSTAGVLAVEQLQANLPGGTRVDIQGRIGGQGKATTFQGDVIARGTSLARAVGWGSGGAMAIAPAHDRPFQIRSRLVAEPGKGSLKDLIADIGGASLNAEIDYTWSGARTLKAVIEGPRIDARAVVPGGLRLSSFTDRFGADDKPAGDLDVSLKLTAAEVLVPDRTLRDVVAVIGRGTAGNRLERLQFTTEHGVALSLEGPANALARRAPGGQAPSDLTGSAAAGDVEGLKMLADFLGFPLAALAPVEHLSDFVPLRLAGTFSRRARADAAAPGSLPDPRRRALELAVDGQLGQADARVRAMLAGGTEAWRTEPVDIDVVMMGRGETPLGERMLALLRGSAAVAGQTNVGPARAVTVPGPVGSGATAPTKARLAIKAIGVPANGLATAVRFDSADATVFLNGRSELSETGRLDLAGDITTEARDGRRLLGALLGTNLGLADPLAVKGTAGFRRQAGALSFTDLALTTASGAKVGGEVRLSPASAGTPGRRLEGDVTLSRLSVNDLLGPVLTSDAPEISAALRAASGGGARPTVWPQRGFSFGRQRDLEMALKLQVTELVLDDALSVDTAKFDLFVRPDGVDVANLVGTLLGGSVAGSAKLSKTAAGAALQATLAVSGARLSRFGGTGTLDGSLTVDGSGASPASIVTGLGGKGTVKLGAAEVRDVTPATLLAVVETALKGAPDKLGTALRAGLAADAARAPIGIGPRAVSFDIKDGVARAQAFSIATADGQASAQASLDLSSLALSGAWRVETRLAAMPGQTAEQSAVLPAIVRRFQILPADLAPERPSRRGAFEVDALERELAVRKVERDLAELERLRKLDEDRAAQREFEAKAAEWARQTESKAETKLEPTPGSTPSPKAEPRPEPAAAQ